MKYGDKYSLPLYTDKWWCSAFRIFMDFLNFNYKIFRQRILLLSSSAFRPLEGPPSVRAANSSGTTSQLEDTRSDHEIT